MSFIWFVGAANEQPFIPFFVKTNIRTILYQFSVETYAKGSHHVYFNEAENNTAIVPVHGNKDLKTGTFLGILKQASIDKNDA